MLHGYDISNNNWPIPDEDWFDISTSDFVWMKASEGRTYKDSRRDDFVAKLHDSNAVKGFYHFARPELNDPDYEAENFLAAINPYIATDYYLLALDWEGEALKHSTAWIKEWFKVVEKAVEGKPLLYVQKSAVKDFYNPIKSNGNGLWVADWNCKPGTVDNSNLWAFHQYMSYPYDQDVFNGNLSQLLKYRCILKNNVLGKCTMGCKDCWRDK